MFIALYNTDTYIISYTAFFSQKQMINQTVLSNRRAYADLYARLMMSDIEREKKLHTQWKRRLDDWKKLHTEKACAQFE